MLNSILIDTSKCIGCRACQVACKQWNRLPAEETSFTGYYENPVRFTANSWTRVVFREHEDESTGAISWYFAKKAVCTVLMQPVKSVRQVPSVIQKPVL